MRMLLAGILAFAISAVVGRFLIPALRARNSTASGKLSRSISIMKLITLPPLPQPKQ